MSRARLLVMVALLSGSAAAEPLGRLFFTPEQRAAADRQRAAAAPGATQRLDGLLTRSSGKATRWINGQAQHGSPTALGIAGNTLTVDAGGTVQLRVGESVDTATREKIDVVAAGAVRKSR